MRTNLGCPETDPIEYDREELRAELERAAAEIDGEIKSLEDAVAVTREVLEIEFTIKPPTRKGPKHDN